MRAQQPMRNAMESAHPHAAHRHREQRLSAAAHLRCRFVRERDCEYAVWRDAFGFDEPSNAMHEDTRLAAAGSGHHEVVAERRGDRFALPIV